MKSCRSYVYIANRFHHDSFTLYESLETLDAGDNIDIIGNNHNENKHSQVPQDSNHH